MSTSEQTGELPPSPEVQRQMALIQIESFRAMNTDFRQLVEIIHAYPSSKRLQRLRQASDTIKDSADPFVETMCFRDIGPGLVGQAVEALIDEINQNNELALELEGDDISESEYDEEFRHQMTERILDYEPGYEEPTPEILMGDPLDMSTVSMVKFVCAMHNMSVHDVLENLEESDKVDQALEREYNRKERMRTVIIGVVAFAGAFGGTIAANRFDQRQ